MCFQSVVLEQTFWFSIEKLHDTHSSARHLCSAGSAQTAATLMGSRDRQTCMSQHYMSKPYGHHR